MKVEPAIARLDVFVYRHVSARAVTTSFGVMRDRPAVFVRIEDRDGAFGWGEIFANWPSAGAEHRARLLMEDIADLVLGTELREPSDLYRRLTRKTHIRALQSGEWGPFRQVIAGLDIAAWDLFARRANMPLRDFLNPKAAGMVPAYASGIHIRTAAQDIEAAQLSGFTAFKVKVGFDLTQDAADVNALSADLAEDERLCADANQAWDLAQAMSFIDQTMKARLGWLEEPIPADMPLDEWSRLANHGDVPLAGGENIVGLVEFASAIESGALSVFQPDVAKWGGITDCMAVAQAVLAAGKTYCPHFLGGGIGLMASAHLLAAVGGDGALEVDVNANPLRDSLAPISGSLQAGNWHLSDAAGLGIETMPSDFKRMQTMHQVRRL
jgi:L-alanine-DL-glutamate epimerase-like enolase superfamily enzyme